MIIIFRGFHFNTIQVRLNFFAFPSRPVCAAVATSVSAIYGTEIFQTGEGRKVHSEIEMASYSLARSISCERAPLSAGCILGRPQGNLGRKREGE